jgi:hypothetical protein
LGAGIDAEIDDVLQVQVGLRALLACFAVSKTWLTNLAIHQVQPVSFETLPPSQTLSTGPLSGPLYPNRATLKLASR